MSGVGAPHAFSVSLGDNSAAYTRPETIHQASAEESHDMVPQQPLAHSVAEPSPWSEDETAALVEGCKKYGFAAWTEILSDPALSSRFANRTASELFNRMQAISPDLQPTRRDSLTSCSRTRAVGRNPEKGRSRERRPFRQEEDMALRRGYELHGAHWALIARDPAFQNQRSSTDVRDRFRNAFPDEYVRAGYKPRTKSSKSRDRQKEARPRSSRTEHLARRRSTPLLRADAARTKTARSSQSASSARSMFEDLTRHSAMTPLSVSAASGPSSHLVSDQSMFSMTPVSQENTTGLDIPNMSATLPWPNLLDSLKVTTSVSPTMTSSPVPWDVPGPTLYAPSFSTTQPTSYPANTASMGPFAPLPSSSFPFPEGSSSNVMFPASLSSTSTSGRPTKSMSFVPMTQPTLSVAPVATHSPVFGQMAHSSAQTWGGSSAPLDTNAHDRDATALATQYPGFESDLLSMSMPNML